MAHITGKYEIANEAQALVAGENIGIRGNIGI
jgi:hypothetical protein